MASDLPLSDTGGRADSTENPTRQRRDSGRRHDDRDISPDFVAAWARSKGSLPAICFDERPTDNHLRTAKKHLAMTSGPQYAIQDGGGRGWHFEKGDRARIVFALRWCSCP